MSSTYKLYNPDGIIFVSTAVVFWMDVFVRRVYKEIFTESLVYCIDKKGLVVHAWVIMPSHFHLIISRNSEEKLEAIIRDFKKFTSTKITETVKNNIQESRREWMMNAFRKAGSANGNNMINQLWQQDNHPIELSTNKMMDDRLNYIPNNPVEAGFTDKPEEYLYSSARNYMGIKGMIPITIIQ